MSSEIELRNARSFKAETKELEAFVAVVKQLRTWQRLAELNPSNAACRIVLGLVFSVRSPSEGASLDLILDNDGFGLGRLKTFAAEMKRLSAEVEQLNKHPLLSPLIFLEAATSVRANPNHSIPDLKRLVETLPAALAFYAACLDESPHPILRQRVSAKRKGTEYWLYCLDCFLHRALGVVDYEDVAKMLTPAGKAADPENIRRQIRRFKQRQPELSNLVHSTIVNWPVSISDTSFNGVSFMHTLLLA